ncbi:MAG: type II 3-dehydroquinate dehydratase [Evtepia gabavorous]
MNILVINGPNLNLLGVREPDLYGKQDYTALVALVEETCAQEGMEVEVFQSNHEGAIVDRIQAALGTADGIVINPAAYTHTSVAILDALKAVNLPAVEVHISDVSQREDFRRFPCWHGLRADLWDWGWRATEGHPFLKDYLQHR